MKYDRRRAARESIRARERAELAALKLQLGEALERRKRLVREARALCKRGRLSLRAKLKAKREALRLEGIAARASERGACRARKAAAKRSGARGAEAARVELAQLKRSQKVHRTQAGEKKRSTAIERMQESEDAVLRDIPSELHGVWAHVRKKVKGSSRRSRAEAFLEWAEENPGEVVAFQQADADLALAEMFKQHRAMTKRGKMRKTKAQVEAELRAAGVPF